MSTKMDPYTELGVGREANDQQIREAYRRLSKSFHPDMPGGDEEKFARLKLASEILLDKARRKKFDNTGEIDQTVPDNTEAAALSEINRLISVALLDEAEPEQQDVAHLMREGLRHIIGEMQAEKRKLDRALRRAERMSKMFVHVKGGENLFPGSLDWHKRQIVEMQKSLDLKISVKELALEILRDYRFERYQTAIEAARSSGSSSSPLGALWPR